LHDALHAERSGHHHAADQIPFDDLAIGASAIEQGYAMATRNARHFG
jgi:predicted nucleic acid-binding protein